jgi:hypothetical protein
MPPKEPQVDEDKLRPLRGFSNYGCLVGVPLILISFPLLLFALKGALNMHAKDPGLGFLSGMLGILCVLGGLSACISSVISGITLRRLGDCKPSAATSTERPIVATLSDEARLAGGRYYTRRGEGGEIGGNYSIEELRDRIERGILSGDDYMLRAAGQSQGRLKRTPLREWMRIDSAFSLNSAPFENKTTGEQVGADQPATAPESTSKGAEKPKPEPEGRSL